MNKDSVRYMPYADRARDEYVCIIMLMNGMGPEIVNCTAAKKDIVVHAIASFQYLSKVIDAHMYAFTQDNAATHKLRKLEDDVHRLEQQFLEGTGSTDFFRVWERLSSSEVPYSQVRSIIIGLQELSQLCSDYDVEDFSQYAFPDVGW